MHNGKCFGNFVFMQNNEYQVFVISEYQITNIRSVYQLTKIRKFIMVNIFRDKTNDPRLHSFVIFMAVAVFMVIAFLIKLVAPDYISGRFYWTIATAFMLFYAVFSSIASIASDNIMIFWGKAMYSYMALAVAAGGLAYFFSGISIFDAGSFSWLYTVITIVYVVFMTLVRSMKMIVEFAQKEEWTSPNLRNKKKS
jgi:hypothetical protein